MAHFISLPPPEPFDASSDTQNASKRWKNWAERFEDFINASGISDEQQKCSLLTYTAGKEVAQLIRELPAEQKPKTLKETLETLKNSFEGRKSIVYARYQFRQCVQQHANLGQLRDSLDPLENISEEQETIFVGADNSSSEDVWAISSEQSRHQQSAQIQLNI
jgi:hypothetical protein